MIRPLLAADIDGRIAGVVRRIHWLPLPLEAFLASPRLQPRAVDGKVLRRQQPTAARLRDDILAERAGDVAIEQAVPILG